MKEKTTRVRRRKVVRDTMRPEYDFSTAVRGKYYKRITQSSNVVVLDPDIAARFANSKAVNDALRNLLRVTEATERLTTRPKQRTKNNAA